MHVMDALIKLCSIVSQSNFLLDAFINNFLCYVLKGYLENTEKDRIKRLIRLKPPTEFWMRNPEVVILQWLAWVLFNVASCKCILASNQRLCWISSLCNDYIKILVLKSSQFLALVFLAFPNSAFYNLPSFPPLYPCMLYAFCVAHDSILWNEGFHVG